MKNIPEIIQGFSCYHPEVALKSDDYPIQIYEHLKELEGSSFWFSIRNALIKYVVEKYFPRKRNFEFLEIGCGSGFVLKYLKQFSGFRLTGADIYLNGLKFAAKRVPGIPLIQLDAVQMNIKNKYHAIGMFDVLEHISEDTKVIGNISKALKKSGLFLLTVPQHRILWSKVDEIANHKRRYARKDISRKLESNGFRIVFCSSFITTLFPVFLLIRKMKNLDRKDASFDNVINELKTPTILNTMLEYITRIDLYLINLGLPLPYGGSLMILAEKKG